MSVRPVDYDLLGGHLDLSSDIKSEAPPYLPKDLLPPYNLKPHMPHGRRPRALDNNNHFSQDVGPDDASLRGFNLAESIWSQESDLTLDDLPLESDSASSHSRSGASSRWSAAPSTPSSSHHLDLLPTQETAPAPEPVPSPVEAPLRERVPQEPDSPAPAYSRDPLEFDPALLASLDPQLSLHPFEAFEDVCWSRFPDLPLPETVHSPRSRSTSFSRHRSPTTRPTLTVHSSFSDASMATVLAPPLPPLPSPPSLPPPAYPISKPLPNIPPPSPRPSAGNTQRRLASHSPPVVMAFESFVTVEDTPFPTAPADETVHFFPVRAPARPRSKSVGGTKTVRRLTSAIARLRGRE